MARFNSVYGKWRNRVVPSGDGHKITLTVRLYPQGTRTKPGQCFGVYADNDEGVGVSSAQDLDQLFSALSTGAAFMIRIDNMHPDMVLNDLGHQAVHCSPRCDHQMKLSLIHI